MPPKIISITLNSRNPRLLLSPLIVWECDFGGISLPGIDSPLMADPKRDFLRHTLATLVYRARKAIGDAPEGFDAFPLGEKTRTPLAILAHINDVLDWALSMANGTRKWNVSS